MSQKHNIMIPDRTRNRQLDRCVQHLPQTTNCSNRERLLNRNIQAESRFLELCGKSHDVWLFPCIEADWWLVDSTLMVAPARPFKGRAIDSLPLVFVISSHFKTTTNFSKLFHNTSMKKMLPYGKWWTHRIYSLVRKTVNIGRLQQQIAAIQEIATLALSYHGKNETSWQKISRLKKTSSRQHRNIWRQHTIHRQK